MNKTVTTCDECGVEKKETNHWFLVWLSLKDKNLVVSKAKRTDPSNSDDMKDVCGQQCATAMFSRWLSYGEIESVGAERKEKS